MTATLQELNNLQAAAILSEAQAEFGLRESQKQRNAYKNSTEPYLFGNYYL